MVWYGMVDVCDGYLAAEASGSSVTFGAGKRISNDDFLAPWRCCYAFLVSICSMPPYLLVWKGGWCTDLAAGEPTVAMVAK